jgi:hypothetical protein
MSKKKNKRNEANKEQVVETYKCCVCGNIHKLNEFCPIVKERLEKIKYHEHRYEIVNSIILECLKRKYSISQLFAELDYVCNVKQIHGSNEVHTITMPWLMPLMENKEYYHDIGIDYFLRRKVCLMGIGDLDLVAEYAATYLDCSISVFNKTHKQILSELLSIVFNENFFVDFPDQKKIYKDLTSKTKRYGIRIDDIDCKTPVTKIIKTLKHFNKECVTLRLTYSMIFDSVNSVASEKIKVELSKYIYRDGSSNYDIVVCPRGIVSDKDQNIIDSKYRYRICFEDIDNQIKALFEKGWNKSFDVSEYLPKREPDSLEAITWLNRIRKETTRGVIRWKYDDTEYFRFYETARLGFRFILKYSFGRYIFIVVHLEYDGFWSVCDSKDLDCIYYKSLEKIIQASCTKQYREQIKADRGKTPCQLSYADVLVVGNTLWCEKIHTVTTCWGLVPILTENEILSYKIFLGYCEQCNRYYMYQDDYEEMIKIGKPLCDVIADGKLINRRKSEGTFHFKAQSIIHAMGYTVQAKSNLSREERRDILDTAIEKRFATPNEIVNFLTWLVVTRKPMKQYETAINKWSEDKKYIQKKYADDEVGVKKITVRG